VDENPEREIDLTVRGTDGKCSQGDAIMLTTQDVGFAQLCGKGLRGSESIQRNIRAEFISGRPPNHEAAPAP